MANPSKSVKLGRYLCKVDYLDLRQKIDMPRTRRLNNGEKQIVPGKVEVFVYYAKNQVAGPYKSHKEAKLKAEELVSKKFRYKKEKK